jgi:acyl carrier protein
MTKSDFLRELEKALDVPSGSIAGNEKLKELSCWDSMAALTFLSLADQQLQVTITASQLRACQSVPDLLGLLGDKLTP